MLRLLAVVRVARVERILWRLTRLREALYTLFLLLGTFRKVASALFLTFYLYSTVGVQIFGGLITRDADELADLDFGVAGGTGYYANNFNDFASGLVVLFELMVVNNWFVIAGGLAAVAPLRAIGWLFCISFYMFVHVVVLNILVTSVVESFERIFSGDQEEVSQAFSLQIAVGEQNQTAPAAKMDGSDAAPSLLPDSAMPLETTSSKKVLPSAKKRHSTQMWRSEADLLLGDAEDDPERGNELNNLLKAHTRSNKAFGSNVNGFGIFRFKSFWPPRGG